MATPIVDLDELILRCRDEKAKTYITEAVASYRSGAYRSAIVASWIAVCFDIIEKLRELALAGDKEAEKQIADLETTRRSGDITRALKFERELLELARDKFELISHLEFVDLERLQVDRNRCAHPSLASEEQAYAPSAELARVHIHSSVTHLLQHPPAQGKYALDRLKKEISSEYFPTDRANAKVSLASGPLRRPRESLVRNLIVVLIKGLLNENPQFPQRRRYAAALDVLAELHPKVYGQTLAGKLAPVLRAIEDENLFKAVEFLSLVKDCWQYFPADMQQRLQNYVMAIPADSIDTMDSLLELEPLRQAAEHRIARATRDELKNAIFLFGMPQPVVDRLITIYLESHSFDEANEWAKQLSFNASDFSADQVRRVIANVSKNSQVRNSFELGALINQLRARKIISETEFDHLLAQHSLEEYSSVIPHQG